MIDRCYNEKQLNNSYGYDNTVVSDDWLIFSNFEKWCRPKYSPPLQLDKDLKTLGANVYSENNCLLVEKEINCFLSNLFKCRGDLLMGTVYYSKRAGTKTWRAQINNGSGSESIGWFYSEKDAHRAWQLEKINRAKYLINTVAKDEEVVYYLNLLIDKISNDVEHGIPTVFIKEKHNV